MKIKKAFLISSLLTAIMAVNAFGAIKVTINSKETEFKDAQPEIVNNRTMVPVRSIFEKLGFSVAWNNEKKTALLSGNNVRIQLSQDDIKAYNKTTGMEIPVDTTVLPLILNDRFYLPLRSIAETTGCSVDWNGENKIVEIKTRDYVEKLEKEAENENESSAETVTSLTEEKTLDQMLKDADKRGDITETDEEYISKMLNCLQKIKELALQYDDPTLLRLYSVKYTSENISPSGTNYSEINALCDELDSLTCGKLTEEVDKHVKDFVKIIRNATALATSSKASDEQYTEKIDSLGRQRSAVSIDFAKDLYDYFIDNSIIYEKLFGDYSLDAMN